MASILPQISVTNLITQHPPVRKLSQASQASLPSIPEHSQLIVEEMSEDFDDAERLRIKEELIGNWVDKVLTKLSDEVCRSDFYCNQLRRNLRHCAWKRATPESIESRLNHIDVMKDNFSKAHRYAVLKALQFEHTAKRIVESNFLNFYVEQLQKFDDEIPRYVEKGIEIFKHINTDMATFKRRAERYQKNAAKKRDKEMTHRLRITLLQNRAP